MNNIFDLNQEKQNILNIFEKINDEVETKQRRIKNLELENKSLREAAPSKPIVNNDQRALYAQIELLNHQKTELETVLKTTKARIGELSNILIDKETQIKELKANQSKRTSGFDINESEQLFEAKMAVSEKDKIIRKLESKLAKLEQTNNASELTTTINELEQSQNHLISENQELKAQLATNSQVNQAQEPEVVTISSLEAEFEFSPKAKLALKLLLSDGLARDQFKQALIREHEIIDSFVAEVNGQFEDEYYFELINENKNYYTINSELYE